MINEEFIIDDQKLINNIVLFIYNNYVSGIEQVSYPEYLIGRTITTNKYYVSFNCKMINYKFPRIPYIKTTFINNKYLIDFDFDSEPIDEVDQIIIHNKSLSNPEKLLVIHVLNKSNSKTDEIPDSILKKYKNS